jgi:hypothetical protein
MIVVVVVMTITVMMIGAAAFCFLQLFATFVRLSAALAMALDCIAQLVFCLVNPPFTSFVGPRG